MECLEVLNSRELRNFGDFVHSPFFNKHRETMVLFDFLYQKKGEWDVLTKREIFSAVFFKDPYQEGKINDLMSYLMVLLNKYLGQLAYEKSGYESFFMVEGPMERNMRRLFQINSRKERKKIEKSPVKDDTYYLKLSEIDRINDYYYSTIDKEHSPVYLETSDRRLETWFIIRKLRAACDMLNRKMIYDYDYDLGILNHLLTYLKERWDYFGEVLLIRIYYEVLTAFLTPQEPEHFLKLVDLIEKDRDKFNQSDTLMMFDLAINLGINFINLDEKMYGETTFKLYQLAIEDGFHLDNQEIHHMWFKNIITLACKLRYFEWAKDFMDTNRGFLNPEIRNNAYNFNLGQLYYHQQNYNEALKLLNKVNFENVFYQMNAKIMQIKIFFNLKEYGVLLSFLESYRLYLIRIKKVSSARIKMTQNFVKYTRKFVYLLKSAPLHKRKNLQKKLQKLKEELLETESPILTKEWLMENLEKAIKG